MKTYRIYSTESNKYRVVWTDEIGFEDELTADALSVTKKVDQLRRNGYVPFWTTMERGN